MFRLQWTHSQRAAEWCDALSAEDKSWPTQWYDITPFSAVCPGLYQLVWPLHQRAVAGDAFVGLAMIALLGGDLASFAPQTGATGPILESAAIVATTGVAGDGVRNEYLLPR